MEELTIGELANQGQVATSTLRYYESVGLLIPLKRVSGQRRYSEKALSRLNFIKLAQQAGFSGLEIKTLLVGVKEQDNTPPLSHWQLLASQKLTEIEALIERAQRMKALLEDALRCGCLDYEECQERYEQQGHC